MAVIRILCWALIFILSYVFRLVYLLKTNFCVHPRNWNQVSVKLYATFGTQTKPPNLSCPDPDAQGTARTDRTTRSSTIDHQNNPTSKLHLLDNGRIFQPRPSQCLRTLTRPKLLYFLQPTRRRCPSQYP